MKKAIKASKEALRLPQQTRDSSEGAGITPEVSDEFTVKFTTSSEGASIAPEVPDEGKGKSATKADAEIDWGSEDDSHQSDDEYVDEGEITWLSTDEEEKSNEDDDEEEDDDMSINIAETDDERTESENDDQEMNDAEKIVGEKLEEEKGDEEEEQADDDQAQEDQDEDDITTTTTTPTPLTKPIPTPPITSTTELVTSPLPATKTPDAPIPPSEALTAVLERVSTLEKVVKELKQIDHSTVILESIRSQVPPAVNKYLRSSLGDSLQKVLQKHTEELKQEFKQQESQKSALEIMKIKQEHASKQKWPKYSSTPFDKNAENEYKHKDILFKMMLASKSYEKHPAHQALYDALIQSLFVDEDDMDQVAAAMGESALLKRKHDDQDEDPTVGSNQGKDKKRPRKDTQPSKKSYASKESSKGNTPPKTYKSGKFVTVEEPNEEHVHDMSLDAEENIADEMGKADEHPDGEAAPKNDWLKQLPRPPTPDLEWNKCQAIDDQP
ncbi:hypothetical protein Tco_0328215 [Tanacetum coccineum]